MKKYIFKSIPLLAILVFLPSCEDVIKIDLPKGKPLFVVDAFINDFNEKQIIKLSNSTPYFETQNAAPINGATVTVTDITKNRSYNFVFNGNGSYELNNPILAGDTLVVENHFYKLKIEYNGDVYESETKVNRNTTMDTLRYIPRPQQGDIRPGFFLEFIGNDISGSIKDYYWFRVKRNGKYIESQFNVAANAGGGDGTATDGINFIPPVSIFSNNPKNDSWQLGDAVRVEMWSVEKIVFDFWNGVETESNNGGLFATVPENIVTNIKKTKSATEYSPVGCFSISQVDIIEGIVPIETAK
jgi:hypothetical protein